MVVHSTRRKTLSDIYAFPFYRASPDGVPPGKCQEHFSYSLPGKAVSLKVFFQASVLKFQGPRRVVFKDCLHVGHAAWSLAKDDEALTVESDCLYCYFDLLRSGIRNLLFTFNIEQKAGCGMVI